jgi:hypothetical protein
MGAAAHSSPAGEGFGRLERQVLPVSATAEERQPVLSHRQEAE